MDDCECIGFIGVTSLLVIKHVCEVVLMLLYDFITWFSLGWFCGKMVKVLVYLLFDSCTSTCNLCNWFSWLRVVVNQLFICYRKFLLYRVVNRILLVQFVIDWSFMLLFVWVYYCIDGYSFTNINVGIFITLENCTMLIRSCILHYDCTYICIRQSNLFAGGSHFITRYLLSPLSICVVFLLSC